MTLSLAELALLAVAALVAGAIDAVAGGGGLITLPALLAVGLPPHLALGTNKGQSVFGSGAALVRFARAGLIERGRLLLLFPLGLAGSAAGAALVLVIAPSVLRPLVLVLLVAAGAFVALQPRLLSRVRAHQAALAPAGAAALVIGAYDGFFGPATGTFLIVAFVALLGDTLVQASATAKIVNFASNLAAVLLFASRGVVVWRVALVMAGAQFVGGYVGAHLTVQGGDRLVRRVVLVVVAAFVVKLAHDAWVG